MPIGGGNPFWSERATGELRLRMSRPAALQMAGEFQPVPGDDEDVRRQLEQVDDSQLQALGNREDGSGREGRGDGPSLQDGRGWRRSRSRASMESLTRRMNFTTPESWVEQGAVQGEPLRSAGAMPAEEGNGGQSREMGRRSSKRTEGLIFSTTREDGSQEDSLQREVEKEMVKMLQEENDQLRHQMAELMKRMETRSGKSEWSEVTAESPRLKREMPSKTEVARYTLNGTKVPEGPPPVECGRELPPVPPWPFPEWEIYEKDEGGRGKRMELESMEWELHRGPPGGGVKSRWD